MPGRRSGPASRMIIVAVMIILFLISCASKADYPSAVEKGGDVIVELSRGESGVPQFYSITLEGTRIKFFVVKRGGSAESYLDACRKCYIHGKGFRVDGSRVYCNYCNTAYPIESLHQGIGSCHPIPIEGTVQGDRYYIKRSELEKALKYF